MTYRRKNSPKGMINPGITEKEETNFRASTASIAYSAIFSVSAFNADAFSLSFS